MQRGGRVVIVMPGLLKYRLADEMDTKVLYYLHDARRGMRRLYPGS